LTSLFLLPNKKYGASFSVIRLTKVLLLVNNSMITDVIVAPDPHVTTASILVVLHGGGLATVDPFVSVVTKVLELELNKLYRASVQGVAMGGGGGGVVIGDDNGTFIGAFVGTLTGATVVGAFVGTLTGATVVGAFVGAFTGATVIGAFVGAFVGAASGAKVTNILKLDVAPVAGGSTL
jgi:hypothetical protein